MLIKDIKTQTIIFKYPFVEFPECNIRPSFFQVILLNDEMEVHTVVARNPAHHGFKQSQIFGFPSGTLMMLRISSEL